MRLRLGILCHGGYGGSVRAAAGVAEGLAARGHTVHVFARRLPLGGSLPRDVRYHHLAGCTLSPDRLDVDWSAGEIDGVAHRIAAVVRAERLQTLHFHYGVPFAWVALEACRLAGAARPRVIGTLHGTDVSGYGLDGRTRALLARSLVDVDAVTTVSRSYAALIRERWPGPFPIVIPDFVDTERFRPPSAPAQRSRPRPRIVHVSNFRRVKNPQAVARIFLQLRRMLDADLWLVGDGECMPEAREILAAGGAAGHVRLFGLRPDVETILPRADAMLLASRAESFGLAALEAAACGLPVVAPRVGGLPEVVREGDTGLLYDPGDEVAAAAALLRVLDPATRAVMGAAASRRAGRFSRESVVPRYEALYQRVIEGEQVAAG